MPSPRIMLSRSVLVASLYVEFDWQLWTQAGQAKQACDGTALSGRLKSFRAMSFLIASKSNTCARAGYCGLFDSRKLINRRAFRSVFCAYHETLILDAVVPVQKPRRKNHETRPFADLSPCFRAQENDPGTLRCELALEDKTRVLEQPSCAFNLGV